MFCYGFYTSHYFATVSFYKRATDFKTFSHFPGTKIRNATTCITILKTFNIPDDKKGVDRASTVIARETIEGTDAARLCGVIQYRPTALLEPRV